MRFSINHITVAGQNLGTLFNLAKDLGVQEVEIRNDLPDVVSAFSPDEVRAAAREAGVAIVTINALYPFNCWSSDLERRANELSDYAVACGAGALVMCPLNDGRAVSHENLVSALANLKPIFETRGLTGLVEPLGFLRSSMRTKREAANAIAEVDGSSVYRLVHDTFHHHLAGEVEFFSESTGLVHISGVNEPAIAVDGMSDQDRVLVDASDRLGNVPQICYLIQAGYRGPFSFEAFSPAVHALSDPKSALLKSMEFLQSASAD
ncbi:MAG: TIM barrel protein [Verrucomicrobia bacterium]|nr:TIM barrel protein [Verrucomicrobiota bacterium]